MTSAPVPVPITWAVGTAYDLFASLFVLHNAETTGLRRAWAAGVRNRLAVPHRELLQELVPIVAVPVEWIRTLGSHPNAASALGALESMPDDAILPALADREFLRLPVVSRVMHENRVSRPDIDELLSSKCPSQMRPNNPAAARSLLSRFAHADRSGALLRAALVEYQEQFFGEEEHRIAGHLVSAGERAQANAAECPVVDLVEELSGGLRLEHVVEATGLLLIPSFWAGPLVLFEMLPDKTWVIIFSARPRDISLIPGDPVPDALTRSLHAVSDQTRLRILKLLRESPRTQVEIARELRLRPPTITHHLKILRLANLIRLTENTSGEKRYDVRGSRLLEIGHDLSTFVGLE